MIVRKAKISDVKTINKIIDSYAKRGIMLFRPIYEIYGNIRDYFTTEVDKKIVGCCALHVLGKEYNPGKKEFVLAEIRSLVVLKNYQKQGIGTELIKECIEESREMKIDKIFALTVKKNARFFKKLGFKEAKKSEIPQKIWQECIMCPRFPHQCNEILFILEI